jgi:ribose transport system permease protein
MKILSKFSMKNEGNSKSGTNSKRDMLDYIAKNRWVIPLVFIMVYFITYSIVFPKVFLSSYNISSLLLEFSIPAIIVIGMALQLINGEIDLSVGFNVMFTNILAGTLIVLGVPMGWTIIIVLVVACVLGFIVGTLVSRIGVNSFIATLGMGLIYYGLTQFVYTSSYNISRNGIDIRHLPETFTKLSKGEFLGLQLPVYYAAVLLILFSILMAKSRYFKKYYYIGMNVEASRLSGISVKNMKTITFVLSSLFASVAGILIAARMGASAATYGTGWELKVITACVIGGVSMKGGRGTMGGAVLGMLFAICLTNALRIAYAPSNLYKIIEGSVLLGAVILDAQMSKRKVVG